MPKFIIANWKANKNWTEVESWLNQFKQGFGELAQRLQQSVETQTSTQNQASHNQAQGAANQAQVAIAPAYPFLAKVSLDLWQTQEDWGQLPGVALTTAVQDLSPYGQGKYTGAVCAQNLMTETGSLAKFVLLGHSERRTHFEEDCVMIARKVRQAVEFGLRPVLCLDQPYFFKQAEAFAELGLDLIKIQDQLLLAYEPVNAIGSGQSVDPAHAQQIKQQLLEIYPSVPVLYGGSVQADNVASYLAVVDGTLIGTAALEASSFVEIIATTISHTQSGHVRQV